jgi:hypothetical protein
MQNAVITNQPPFPLFYRLSEFFIIQSNYSTFNEIIFTDHVTKDFANPLNTCTVAVFRIKPKGDRMAVNMDGELEAYETMYR